MYKYYAFIDCWKILNKKKSNMKKLVKITVVVAFAAIAGYGVYVNQKTDALSDLALANVEALANGEWGTGFNCRWADANYWFCTPLGDGLGCPCFM